MFRRLFVCLLAAVLLAAAATSQPTAAHEGITVGDYTLEYGWLSEPPVAGQANAIVVNVSGGSHAPSAGAPSGASAGPLAITEPADGAAIAGDQLAVTVAPLPEAPEGNHHWHLYVDGVLATMLPIETLSYTLKGLTNGSHEIAVALSDSRHQDVGTRSRVTVEVTGSSAGDAPQAGSAEVDLSELTVEIVYGSQARVLVFQPAAGSPTGHFQAALTPARPGQYLLRFAGRVGGTPVDAEVKPEEVLAADALAFPAAPGTASASGSAALYAAIAGIVLGLAGVGLGAAALLRRR
jgi:hypothetical protein